MTLNSKQDFTDLMFRILNPLKKNFSEDKARIILSGAGATYAQDVIEFETFSRPLWALVPFFAGGGNDSEFQENYLKGFASGTNPNNIDYWGGFTDRDQRFVEMAALSTALIFSGEKLFKPLESQDKENFAKWLYEINNYILPENNWLFFRVLVNIALKKNNLKYSQEQLDKDLETLDSYYIEDGWYKDGVSEHRDYYVAFAIHFYGLLYAKEMETEDAERSLLYKERAKDFANDYIYFFANKGEAIPYGRSLTYRFAQCAFFSATVFADVEIFDMGVVKGIITRHLEYWLGCEIFDSGDILNIGYSYQNLIMSERYNSPGSPYWGMKVFLLLALDDDHIFWKTEAKPLPKLDPIRPLKHANMIVQRLDSGNDVVGFLPAELELYGHGHIIEKYSKFAYSTAFGFSVMRSAFCLDEATPDSMLAFVIDDTVFVRKISKEYQVLDNQMISKWSPFVGIEVETTIILTETGHRRQHTITSDYECLAYDCGFSVPRFVEDFSQSSDINSLLVRGDKKACKVISNNNNGRPYLINSFPNTNILFKNTVLPSLEYKINKGTTTIDSEIKTYYYN